MYSSRALFLSLTFLLVCSLSAQDLGYVNELNQGSLVGDARFNAMAGSMTALSGSMTALAVNPAAVAWYRQPTWSTFANIYSQSNTRSNTSRNIGQSAYLNIAQLGYVNATPNETWRWFFTVNTNDLYREKLDYSATPGSSILEQWINSSAGTPPEFLPNAGVYEDLVYQSYATDFDPNDLTYYASADLSDVELEHQLRRRGLSNEWKLGVGRSFGPTLHIGAAVQFDYNYEKVDLDHYERYSTTQDLRNFRLTENWKNEGFGLGGSVGAQWRPLQQLRFGAALHLPRILAFEQTWSVNMQSYRPGLSATPYSSEAVGAGYEWYLLTAPRLHSGAALIGGKWGLISLSHTLIPSQWSTAFGEEAYLNPIVDTALGWQQNASLGAEVRLGPIALRAGAGFIGIGQDAQPTVLQRGLGFSFVGEAMRYELAWTGKTQLNNTYFPYSADYVEPLYYDHRRGLVTFGASWRL